MTEIKATYIDAYAAGFLEADGCIYVTDSGASVRITNRNLDVLNWFKKNYGGQVRSKVVPKGCWEWNIHSEGAINFIERVYKYLIFKNPQADLFLRFASTKQKRGSKLSEGTINLRESIKTQMKKEKAQWRA